MHDIRTDHALPVTPPAGGVTCVPGHRGPGVLSLAVQRMRWAQGAA
ncbi:hypothetical protein [Kytococcus sedentarius]